MTSLEKRNRRFLTDLFAGPFRGHGIIVSAVSDDPDHLGDFTISSRPVSDWVPLHVAQYQARVKSLETFQDDAVPYVSLGTNTGLFAAAFGCPIHVYEGMETNAAARPIVRTAAEADRLAMPSLDAPGRAVEERGSIIRDLHPVVEEVEFLDLLFSLLYIKLNIFTFWTYRTSVTFKIIYNK